MSRFAFILGHVPVLSSIEAKKLVSDLTIESISGGVLIGTSERLDPQAVMNQSGGMVRIARFASRVSCDNLEAECSRLLLSLVTEGRITFGISSYGEMGSTGAIATRVKKTIKEAGRSVRHVRGKEAVLNGAELVFNDFHKPGHVEVCLIPSSNDIQLVNLFVTEAFQDVGSFVGLEEVLNARDDRSGVLPLRLAKMLVNIAGVNPQDVFLDPFCGSGILVSVAATLGVQTIIASDSSPKAVADAKRNLANVGEMLKLTASWKVGQQDVRTISRATSVHSVDVIVTEPYLGPQTRVANDAELGQMKTLYHEAFKEFRKIVKPGGRVLFIFPMINSIHDFDEVQKSVRGMGFQKVDLMEGVREWFPNDSEPLYSRPRQRVKRLITMWRKV